MICNKCFASRRKLARHLRYELTNKEVNITFTYNFIFIVQNYSKILDWNNLNFTQLSHSPSWFNLINPFAKSDYLIDFFISIWAYIDLHKTILYKAIEIKQIDFVSHIEKEMLWLLWFIFNSTLKSHYLERFWFV